MLQFLIHSFAISTGFRIGTVNAVRETGKTLYTKVTGKKKPKA